jgi:amidase
MDLVGRTAVELARLVRDDQVRAVDVVRTHLDHLARVEHRLGAFVVTRRRAALEEAEELDGRADRTELPLAGVPIAIKDNVDVAGEATRLGSLATSSEPATSDDALVARLRAAGAIVLGKTRCPELCLWGASDDPAGVTVSPWDPTRAAGGSSGGSAAAVTAGIVPVAFAADGLGSIRVPAAACGAVGMRPGPGYPAATLPDGSPHWFGMTRFGPIATTVADAALVLDVLAESDRLREVVPVTGPPLSVAVSVLSPLAGIGCDAAWKQAALEAGRLLRHAGHQVRRDDPPYEPRTAQAVVARWTQGAAAEAAALGVDAAKLQPRTRGHVGMGERLAAIAPVRAEDAVRWRERMAGFFDEHDVLVTPALARTPLAAAEWWRRSYSANLVANAAAYPFAAAWNLADTPAVVVPLWHDRGRPLAVQVVAAPGREELALGVAATLESLVPWRRHAPGWDVPGAG